MSIHLRRCMTALAVMTALAGPARAVLPEEMLKDPALETRARVISQDLRCLVCQNQSIDDSNAPLAKDLRIIVRERLTAGDTDKQVVEYVVARYGNFVLLKPPLQGDTYLLWALPFIVLVAASLIAWRYLSRRAGDDPVPTVEPLSAEELDKFNTALKDR